MVRRIFLGSLGLLAGLAWLIAFSEQASADPAPAAVPGEGLPSTPDLQQEALARAHAARADARARVAAVHAEADARVAAARREAAARVTAARIRAATAKATAAVAVDHGTLYLLQPSSTTAATFAGHGGYSADGLSSSTGGNLQADVPAGSTVVQAYLYGYYLAGTPTLAERTVNFDGSPTVVTKLDDYNLGLLSSARADVTTQVAAKVGGGGGITNFAAATASPLDGLALVVIYANPTLPETTIGVFDGSAQQSGDTATFMFAAPLDKTTPGFSAQMSLGIGFSYQQAGGHTCGPGSPTSKQYSVVDVNNVRLTSCAGNYDDSTSSGGLFTVGGVGDSTNNPTDPNQSPGDGATPRVADDELYDLAPFVQQGDTQLVVKTSQPSGDDILFLSVVQVTAQAEVTTEVCNDGIDNDGDGAIDGADIDCPQPPPSPPVLPVVSPPISPGVVPAILSLPAPEVQVADPSPARPAARPLALTGEPLRNKLLTGLAFIVLGLLLQLAGHRLPRSG